MAIGNKATEVFVVAHNVYSPIGKTTAKNFWSVKNYVSGVKQHHLPAISPLPFFASLFGDDEQLTPTKELTKFERLLIASVAGALDETGIDVKSNNTALIVSTTKGNINLLETKKYTDALRKRIALTTSAQLVADHFGFKNKHIVISNACISGVLAIITGMRLLREGIYENVVVTGADLITKFILSGFQSFQALNAGACRPFDQRHEGLNLGEGAGTIVLSTNKKYASNLKIKGGAVSNDANHISGPSRTGEELAYAIGEAILEAGVGDIGFISAHGTGTVYNDEMEAKALHALELENTPLNSLKGYYGHTLGAAGLIETIMSIESLSQGIVLGTPGFESAPEAFPLNVNARHRQIKGENFLKTASGFGGCNAALIVGK